MRSKGGRQCRVRVVQVSCACGTDVVCVAASVSCLGAVVVTVLCGK